MTYRGHVSEGKVVLHNTLELPEGTEVEVDVRLISDQPAPSSDTSTLRERLATFIGIANDLPADASENHDHYLYGTPKR